MICLGLPILPAQTRRLVSRSVTTSQRSARVAQEVLKSDALVLVTLADSKVSEIQILLDDRQAAKRLGEALRPYSHR